MKAQVRHLHQLMDALFEKTKEARNQKGLRAIAENINGIGEEYLYKKIFYPLKNKAPTESLGMRETQLDSVAQFLGFKTYLDFVASIDSVTPHELEDFVGSYYSYVRRNTQSAAVLRSPVRIYHSHSQMLFELKGPDILYQGTLKALYGCMSVMMCSHEGKSFYHVYKIGKSRRPRIIQGTFAGVSTAFDPIAGRALLIRVDTAFDQLSNRVEAIRDLGNSDSMLEQGISRYFAQYENNNVIVSKSTTFDESDL